MAGTPTVTLKDFAQLANYIDLASLPAGPSEAPAEPLLIGSSEPTTDSPDLDVLLAELTSASALLASVAQADAQVRREALQDLERYDALLSQAKDAESVHQRAEQVRREAETFVASAFGEEARAASERVVRLATTAANAARQLAEHRQQAAVRLESRPDIQRLLEERKRSAEVEQARAAEAIETERRAAALARIREAVKKDELQEAQRLLLPLQQADPEHPEVLAARALIAQRTFVLRAVAAETALRTVRRRELRDDPAQAAAMLCALDVTDLPDVLGRQVFGAWASACRQLCEQRELLEPLRYAPDPGRGLVIARERPNGPYVVISALGMGPRWHPGVELCSDSAGHSPRARQDQHILRRARPLR